MCFWFIEHRDCFIAWLLHLFQRKSLFGYWCVLSSLNKNLIWAKYFVENLYICGCQKIKQIKTAYLVSPFAVAVLQ